MEIPKEQILGLLSSRGDKARAGRADQELPDNVDLNRDSGLLSKLGVDPGELLARFVLAKFGLGKITGIDLTAASSASTRYSPPSVRARS